MKNYIQVRDSDGFIMALVTTDTGPIMPAGVTQYEVVAGDNAYVGKYLNTIASGVPQFSSPVPTDTVFNGADWREYAYRQLGIVALPAGTEAEQDAAGLERYGDILNDADASKALNGKLRGALDQYLFASTFRKDRVTIFIGVMNAMNPKIVTDAEFAAILTNWPQS
jgi:hypothetical protein